MVLDIDDCVTRHCSRDGICTDEHLGFSCACRPGFTGDGYNCSSTVY